MELTPTPARSPPQCLPPVQPSSTQQLCSTLEQRLPQPGALPACPLSRGAKPFIRNGSRSFAAEIFGTGKEDGQGEGLWEKGWG